MAASEFNFFQLDTGVDGGGGAVTNPANRNFGEKVSNFGAVSYGTKNAFGFKDIIANPMVVFEDASVVDNPNVAGSTVKYTRDDKFTILLVPKNAGPLDNKKSNASATVYLPAEGWRSYGGKKDTTRAYQGSRLQG